MHAVLVQEWDRAPRQYGNLPLVPAVSASRDTRFVVLAHATSNRSMIVPDFFVERGVCAACPVVCMVFVDLATCDAAVQHYYVYITQRCTR